MGKRNWVQILSVMVCSTAFMVLFQNCGSQYDAQKASEEIQIQSLIENSDAPEVFLSSANPNVCSHDINVVTDSMRQSQRKVADHEKNLREIGSNFAVTCNILKFEMTKQCASEFNGHYNIRSCSHEVAKQLLELLNKHGVNRPDQQYFDKGWHDCFQAAAQGTNLKLAEKHKNAILACD